mmetsp:Transcript_25500/g.71318  ORF Transcript_25500/g.71318 Transcript_25500/m.71318 type:complete len:316 (-) Transcript_25500:447-1394(-)
MAHLIRLAVVRDMMAVNEERQAPASDVASEYLVSMCQDETPVQELAIIYSTCKILKINLQLWLSSSNKPITFRCRVQPTFVSMALVGQQFLPVRWSRETRPLPAGPSGATAGHRRVREEAQAPCSPPPTCPPRPAGSGPQPLPGPHTFLVMDTSALHNLQAARLGGGRSKLQAILGAVADKPGWVIKIPYAAWMEIDAQRRGGSPTEPGARAIINVLRNEKEQRERVGGRVAYHVQDSAEYWADRLEEDMTNAHHRSWNDFNDALIFKCAQNIHLRLGPEGKVFLVTDDNELAARHTHPGVLTRRTQDLDAVLAQ